MKDIGPSHIHLNAEPTRLRRWRSQGAAVGRAALDFILPPRCPVSGEIVDAPGTLSPASWEQIRFITAPYCDCCGRPFPFGTAAGQGEVLCLSCLRERPPFATARAALAYDDGSRDLILKFKHADQTHMIHSFVPWLRRAGGAMLAEADIIIPVPLHRGRLLKRRYNQAALLAQALSRAMQMPWSPGILLRHKATKVQGHMAAKARHMNVKRAFIVPDSQRAALAGKTVILIDDVYTTGATVMECTRTLLKAGAANVHILTIARVVRE